MYWSSEKEGLNKLRVELMEAIDEKILSVETFEITDEKIRQGLIFDEFRKILPCGLIGKASRLKFIL